MFLGYIRSVTAILCLQYMVYVILFPMINVPCSSLMCFPGVYICIIIILYYNYKVCDPFITRTGTIKDLGVHLIQNCISTHV
jgi:hypothetical protein